MKTNEKILSFLILSALIFMLTGCQPFRESVKTVLEPNPVNHDSAPSVVPMSSKRFQDVDAGESEAQTAIESAIELSNKNAELFEQVMALRQENQDIITENSQLKELVAVLEPELERTKKNLDDAEDLLIDMQIELNNWKTDILGYRDEMRDAKVAQMKMLLKIARAMGVEDATSKQQQDEQSTETSTEGKPNE